MKNSLLALTVVFAGRFIYQGDALSYTATLAAFLAYLLVHSAKEEA